MAQPQAHLSASASGGHSRETQGSDQVIAAVRDALGRLRFGTVQLTIHDGRVVQMDVTEKMRFSNS